MMKRILFSLVFGMALSLNAAFAQSTASEEWKVKYEAAVAEAKAEHKPILMVFAGSDWCKPCIMLSKEVWESEEFKQYAKDNLVLLELDFPRMKKNQLPADQTKQNEELAAKYNKDGMFPLVVLTDEEGNVIAKTGYKAGGPAKYIEHLKELQKN
ncbi:thioredoxin family protein [Pontibacter anaerobius]|uniref:Thioredoxin family protein n=1 Tax=Pontibacter anaerobius TaxID=2993940 RepID=A0ABT3RGS4_9BACT|nr:thioredoxin family protein [Pontibacter anaerobius]MCX2741026.1 thioredoxin family protein [Pontibacter anaerobius]